MLSYNLLMNEMDDAARKATAMECARKVIGFCESRRRVGVTSVSPIVNNFNGGETVGHRLILQGGKKENHLRTTVSAFGLAAVSVSRNAWDHSLTPEGRQLLRNIITIGQTAYSINDPRTIFSLAADRKNHSVINNGS